MIRFLLFSGLVTQILSAPAQAQDDPPDLPETPELSSESSSVAILRGLDKVTARTRDFESPIGEIVEFGTLEITVQYCRKRPPEETPEIFAFLEVDDQRTDGSGIQVEGEQIFSGWCTNAVFDASVSSENMLSPKNAAPSVTP